MKKRTIKDFSPQETVKARGIICKIITAKNGWVTCVPKDKCFTFEMILENEFKVRPSEIKRKIACLDCDWICDCLEFEE